MDGILFGLFKIHPILTALSCFFLTSFWLFELFSYTELEIAAPDSGVIGLHAENLEIERVFVDGEPAEFYDFPHYQPVEIENRWCSVSSVSSAADAAGVTYISALERELVPNLLILCRKPFDNGNQQEAQLNLENGGQSDEEVKKVTLYVVPLTSSFLHVLYLVVCLVIGLVETSQIEISCKKQKELNPNMRLQHRK